MVNIYTPYWTGTFGVHSPMIQRFTFRYISDDSMRDVEEIVSKSYNSLRKELDSFRKEVRKEFIAVREEFKEEIETAVAQVIEAVIKHTASKENLQKVDARLCNIEVDVKDIKRQINDLKADIPTPQEVIDHEKRISKLENAVFPS